MLLLLLRSTVEFWDFLEILQRLDVKCVRQWKVIEGTLECSSKLILTLNQKKRKQKERYEKTYLRSSNHLVVLAGEPAHNSPNLGWNALLVSYIYFVHQYRYEDRYKLGNKYKFEDLYKYSLRCTRARKRRSPAAPAAPSLRRVSACPRTAITPLLSIVLWYT